MFDQCEVKTAPNMKVLVYGSLKRDFGNHGTMERAGGVYLKEGVTLPQYTMISMGYFPGVLDQGDTAIHGEVYEVKDLYPLDGLEGHPSFYCREIITLEDGDEVWMYILQRDGSLIGDAKVDSGIWSIGQRS